MDCSTNKTLGWVIGDRSIKTAKKLYEKLKNLMQYFMWTIGIHTNRFFQKINS
ncbi:hypothetical protein MSIBF_A2320004 [groundwater metagenome]|uniref:Uncharacterized protein n=1 Tax=groundwater metagenome TaxID=717931 RepID=A0A098EAB0_9ZZZZ